MLDAKLKKALTKRLGKNAKAKQLPAIAEGEKSLKRNSSLKKAKARRWKSPSPDKSGPNSPTSRHSERSVSLAPSRSTQML